MQPTIRSFDLAHLAHVELLTPKPEASLRFFVDVLGMTESGRRGDSVYLRGWDDYEHHTLKLTASPIAGMGHFAFRAAGPDALDRRVAAIARAGLGGGWGLKTIETFHTHGTPPIEQYSGPRRK
jgi:catechol 2,3-dioxygenase